MDDLYADWGRRLRERRTQRGLLQGDLAALAESSQAAISRIEKGKSAPSDLLKYRLATALNTSVSDLFPYPPVPRDKASDRAAKRAEKAA